MVRKTTVKKFIPVLFVIFLFVGLIVAIYIIKNDRSLNPNSDAFFVKPMPKLTLYPESTQTFKPTPTSNPRFKNYKTSVPKSTQKPLPVY